MNNNDMDPFTKNDDPTTDTEDSLNRLKELLGEQNSSNNTQSRTDVKMTRSSSGKPRRKNFLKVFVPLIILNVWGSLSGWIIITAIITLIVVCMAYSVQCRNCKSLFAMKKVKEEEIDRYRSSWIADREIEVKDKDGNKFEGYVEERVHGTTIKYKNHYCCKYCGYRASMITRKNIED